MKSVKHQDGQVLLISLLVLAMATTVVLSLVGRTTTDVGITDRIVDSQRAFSAAEAGIEDVLQTGIAASGSTQEGVSYTVTRTGIGGVSGIYQPPNKTSKGTAETIWLTDHDLNGQLVETPTYTAASLDVCWSAESITPAIIVSLYYKQAVTGSYLVARGSFDPDSTRASVNKFSLPTASSGGCGANTGTTYKTTLTLSNFSITPASDTLLYMRVQPVYSDTKLAIASSAVLPLQGFKVESVGSSAGGVSRKITVYQGYRSPGAIFDSVIYSQGNFRH